MKKKILLIDRDDARRETRILLLKQAGYGVEVRAEHVSSEELNHEAGFDLVILALHRIKLKEAAAYSERLRKINPDLPILLLTDAAVYAPQGTLSRGIETGAPVEMLQTIAEMLAGSSHIREIDLEEKSA